MGVKANLATVADQVEFHEHDVCDHEFMHSILDEDFDYIYYLAAIASVADSVERPYETHQVNQESVVDTLEYLALETPRIRHILVTWWWWLSWWM